MARVLFVEPFFGGSHRAFAEGLVAHSRHEVVLLTLPAGPWRERMRRGAQELAARALELEGTFDAIIATDMLDLGTFLALTRRRFGGTPVLYYVHENQFTYPRIAGTKLNSWFGAMNYLGALVADRVAFNSPYHRGDFLRALQELAGQPNNWLEPSAIDAIDGRSEVLPVGVELGWLDVASAAGRYGDMGDGPLVLWNHRWEFDKAPDVFARAILALAEEGIAFRVAIAGEPGPNPHPAMAEVPEALGSRVVQFGMAATREAYAALLRASDIVVSTTRHEFFGVGMVEALYAGCFPVAPAGFTYPWLIPEALHGECLWRDEEDLLAKLRAAIAAAPRDVPALREAAARFGWANVGPTWDAAIDRLAGA